MSRAFESHPLLQRVIDRVRGTLPAPPEPGISRQQPDAVTRVKCGKLYEGDVVRHLDSDGPFSPIVSIYDHESMRDLTLEDGTVIEAWRYGLPLEVRGWRGGLTGIEAQDGREEW